MRSSIILAVALALSACAQPNNAEQPASTVPTAEKTYGDLPFWEGDVCVEIRPDGKRTIVPGSKCPPKV
ncbi:MAG: hypothetical protein AAF557_19480 [Pseudomonadota bacterium]